MDIVRSLADYLLEPEEIDKDVCGVYFIQAMNGMVKIGKSLNILGRLTQIRSQSPLPVWIVGYIEIDEYEKAEKEEHEKYKKYRAHGEWYYPCEELMDRLIDLKIQGMDFSALNKYMGNSK